MPLLIENEVQNLPIEIREQCQTFVLWRDCDGRKMPLDWLGGKRGNNAPELHMTFEQAEQTRLKHNGARLGLFLPQGGVRLSVGEQGGWLHVIDLDGFLCDGQWGDESETIWQTLQKSYCEVSPSLNGLKIFVVSDAPPTKKAKHPLPPSQFYAANPSIKKYGDSHGVEFFSQGFYVALTGLNPCGSLRFVSATHLATLHEFLKSRGASLRNSITKEPQDSDRSKSTLKSIGLQTGKPITSPSDGEYSKLTSDSLVLAMGKIDHHDEQNWSDVANALARVYDEDGRSVFLQWSDSGFGQEKYEYFDEDVVHNRFDRALQAVAGTDGYGCKRICELAGIDPTSLAYEMPDSSGMGDFLAPLNLMKIGAASQPRTDWPDPQPIEGALPKAQAFDLDLLPDAIRPFVADQSDLMQTPPDFLAAGLMVSMAAAVGTRVAIAPKARDTSWLVPLVLWGGAVGRPGTMKTPAMAKAFRPLSMLEADIAQGFDKKLAQHELDLMKYEAARKNAQSAITKGQTASLPVKPEAPQPERLLVNDSTTQKLGEILQHSPLGVLTLRDEITGLLESLSAEGQEAARGFLLEAWNGQSSYRVDRIGRGSFVIKRLAVWLFGGIQPGKLQPYVRQATRGGNGDDGLLQRFQLVVWPDTQPEWKNVDRHPDLKASLAVDEVFRRLRAIAPEDIGAVVDPLGDRLAYLHFDCDAQALFDLWREKLESLLRKETLHPALESHLAKYRSLIPALALLIHLVDVGHGPVSQTALSKAINWATYLRSHAKKVYASATNPAAFSANALADKVRTKKLVDGFTAREVMRHGWQYLTSAEDVREALEWLTDCGWLRCIEKPQSAGGRPTTTYLISPKIYAL